MTLREQIESLASTVQEDCTEDVHEDRLSKLASRIDETSRELIAAIADGRVAGAEVLALCEIVRDMNDTIGEAMEGL